MARCGNCGKANREGALFCQDCGQSLDARAALSDASDARSARPITASSLNAAGANDSSEGRLAVRIGCPQCGQPTPAGFAFCQHCGTRMQASSDAIPHVGGALAAPAGPRPNRSDLPSIDIRPPLRSSGAPVAGGSAGNAPQAAGGASAGVAAVVESAPESARASRPVPASAAARGRLILLRRDGSDGESLPLQGDNFDIGRSEGHRCFPDDVYMASRHARFVLTSGGVRVRALDLTNGVLLQIREPMELQSGDIFYMGRELIRFELLPSEERDPSPIFEHGVRLFGSTPRESWGRLRQLTSAGATRDIWHLCRAEVRIGREEGDIVFPDDEFMSRRHAVLTRHGNRVRLEDQHSSNGTYVRLRGDRELQASDVLRIGDQVLRFEP